MRALVYERFGSPDALELRDVERPTPKENEVLIRVHAVSINDWDWGLLQGKELGARVMAGLSKRKRILGSDVAGRVEQVGRDVTRFKPGDAVFGDLSRFGFGGFGGFAEYARAPEGTLTPKPAGMTFEQAAAIPQAGMLALQGLSAGKPLERGQKVLINGAGGGVGTFALQLAKLKEVEVTGVDSAAKLPMLRSLGFDDVIDYRTEDFTTSRRRYDLILDVKTNRSPFDYARALEPGGTYATVGGTSHLLHVAALGPWIRRRTGKSVRLVMLKQNRDLPYLNALFEDGKFLPVIDGPYPLTDARKAFRRFAAAEHQGKVVVTL